MTDDLADLLRDQHAEMRDLLARLALQPAVTEHVQGPQLRARRRLIIDIRRTFLAQETARLRHLWPALRAAWPDGRVYTSEARTKGRVVEYLFAKRQWFEERDGAANDLEDQIASHIEDLLVAEARHLPRLDGPARRTGIDTTTVARRMQRAAPCPTRPHPDLPRSHALASLLLRPLSVTDRVLDHCSRATE
jgi:hypothetical protein